MSSVASPSPALRSFSLVEMLVVICIIAILITLSLPAFKKVQDYVRTTQCMGRLSQIGKAANLYSLDNQQNTLPPNFMNALNPYLPKTSTLWFCPADLRVKTPGSIGSVSYAYNGDQIGFPPTYWDTSKIRTIAVKQPDKTLYFCDARLYYAGSAKGNQNAQFRHSSNINVLFFDCHVETVQVTNQTTFYDLF